MLQQQINRSADLKRLRDEGYEIQVKGGYLIVHHIPYVNSRREVKFGKLISTLCLNGDVTIRPDTHVISFMGEYPCNNDGTIITAIQHSGEMKQQLFDQIVINFSFSNKPPNGYNDYYEKVVRYTEIISAPAKSIDNSVTAKTFKVIVENEDESLFNYLDSNSSRGNIYQLNSKFKGQRVGIIGLGGTGSYILDLVAKTPVKEILLFDGDEFLQHNAFRSPGAPGIDLLNKRIKKVDYFAAIYSQMHKRIKPFGDYITESNIDILSNLSCVFLCIDSNSARSMIITKLRQFGITFIDTGLGVIRVDDSLIGTVRMTLGTSSKYDHLSNRIGSVEHEDHEYATNIQIADLNALNALMAVIKWKKLCGFYQDLKQEHNTTYTINTSQLINEDFVE